MQISDMITNMILQMLDESSHNVAEIKRNELANEIGCVPSQINYVLASRFTPEHGYIIESRRGGGGYIKIKRVNVSSSAALMHIVNSIGNRLDYMAAQIAIENMYESDLITKETALILKAATGTSTLKNVPVELRDIVRADIFKQIILTQVGVKG